MESMTFKSAAFGGFDRQAVLDSFEETNAKHKDEKQALLQQINKLKERQNEIEMEYARYQEGQQKKNDLIAKLQLLVKKQSADNEKLKQLNLALEKHAKNIREQNEQLKNDPQPGGQSSKQDLERIKKFEDSGYSAERILSEANARSAATLAEANKRASSILTEAAKKAAKNVDESNRHAHEIMEKAEHEAEQLKQGIQKYNQQARKRLNELATEVTTREKRASVKCGEVIRQANQKADEIIQEAKRKLLLANDKSAQFNNELLKLKDSMQTILQQIEAKVDAVNENMPQKLDMDWLVASETIDEQLLPSDDFGKQLLEEISQTQQTESTISTDLNTELDEFEKMLGLTSPN